MKWKTAIYKALKVSNDLAAIKRGRVTQRATRRVVGKIVGRSLRKLFK